MRRLKEGEERVGSKPERSLRSTRRAPQGKDIEWVTYSQRPAEGKERGKERRNRRASTFSFSSSSISSTLPLFFMSRRLPAHRRAIQLDRATGTLYVEEAPCV